MSVKTKIVFYTQVYFLDAAIEYVKLLAKQNFEVHVLIELSPNQLKANILDINTELSSYKALTSFQEVAEDWNLEFLSSYFAKCKSVHFCIYPTKKLRSTWSVSETISNFIIELKPDYIQMDDFTQRSAFLLPLFYRLRKKLLLNIHDPISHSGEFQFKRELQKKIWFWLVPHYVVFSEYSKSILAPQLSKSKKITSLRLMPYTVYTSFLDKKNSESPKNYISFVGRISPYKGIEQFIEAIPKVLAVFPDQQFYIGGKTITGYTPTFLNTTQKNVTIKNAFLTNSNLAAIINDSCLLVCPYKDATQSGVIMSAYALACPVLVTNTGGLPEYVQEGKTGVIAPPNSAEQIAVGIIAFLEKKAAKKGVDQLSKEDFTLDFESHNKKYFNTLYKA